MGSAWGLSLPFNYPTITDPCAAYPEGCTGVGPGPVARSSYTGYMQLSLGYLFARMLWAELAYSNSSTELQPEGSIFFGPSASVSLSASLLVDHLVERVRH